MLLKVQEHLVGPSLAELEAQVPEDFLAGLWPRVQEGLRGSDAVGLEPVGDSPVEFLAEDPRREGEAGPKPPMVPLRPRFSWLVPTLAAASLILVFSTGFLFRELGRLRDREVILAQQVAEQQRWLAELGGGATGNPMARTAALAGHDPWIRALSRQETITLGGLQLLLQRLPGDRTVLTQAQLESVLQSRTPLPLPLLREALGRIDGGDGVSARDLFQTLEGLGADEDFTVPTAELMALLS